MPTCAGRCAGRFACVVPVNPRSPVRQESAPTLRMGERERGPRTSRRPAACQSWPRTPSPPSAPAPDPGPARPHPGPCEAGPGPGRRWAEVSPSRPSSPGEAGVFLGRRLRAGWGRGRDPGRAAGAASIRAPSGPAPLGPRPRSCCRARPAPPGSPRPGEWQPSAGGGDRGDRRCGALGREWPSPPPRPLVLPAHISGGSSNANDSPSAGDLSGQEGVSVGSALMLPGTACGDAGAAGGVDV